MAKNSPSSDYSGEHFVMEYQNAEGKVKMKLVWLKEQKQFFLISLTVYVSVFKVNKRFSRQYWSLCQWLWVIPVFHQLFIKCLTLLCLHALVIQKLNVLNQCVSFRSLKRNSNITLVEKLLKFFVVCILLYRLLFCFFYTFTKCNMLMEWWD